MRAFLRRGSFGIFMALTCASAAACSLLNVLEEVKPNVDASVASDTGTPDVNNGEVDAGPDVVTGPPKGAIVIGGGASLDGGGTESVLTALAPETGLELPKARERMTVAGVRYDGLRDLWYIFESGGAGFNPLPTDPVFLHVRKLDTYTGAWEKLQTLKVPPLESFTHIGVLRERLVYVAYRGGNEGPTAKQLVTVDTTDPSNISVIDTQPIDPVLGLIATRSQSQTPGVLNLLRPNDCDDAGSCQLQLQHATVPPAGGPVLGSIYPLGKYYGNPGFGSYISGGVDLISFKATQNDPAAPIRSFDPFTNGGVGTPTPFQPNDAYLKPIAVAECLGQALLTGTNTELAVYAVPLTTTAAAARGQSGHSGQGVYFDPFTSTVLAPFSQGANYQLTAFTLGGTKGSPTLTIRSAPDWNPPADLRPEIVATRTPLPTVCE
jgi:hypothetical protein